MACARSPSIAACLAAMYLHGNPLLEVQTCAQETDMTKRRKTTPLGVSLMRSQVLHRAAQCLVRMY